MFKYKCNIFNNVIFFKGKNEPVQLVLIDTEGVQHSSFQFAASQQCVTFLAALENGLAPSSHLDPPLCNLDGKGKFFLILNIFIFKFF